ncbi:MAG: MBL fold metallo-hydrolase, partial [Candidatus Njordarchaeota archaeon]
MWQLVELIPPTTIFIDENVMNVASSYVLVRNEDIILVDPGADIIYPLLRMKLSRLGIKKDEIKYIVLTHM